MKQFISVTFVLLICAFTQSAAAQNLITNSGFEDGLNGWNQLFTRDQNTGTAQVTASYVHSGMGALQIDHWGTRDWAFASLADINVSEGEVYEFSAWVRAESIKDYASLSVIVYDSTGEAVSWNYGIVDFVVKPGFFEEYKSKFVIPSGASYIVPRFVGSDSCKIFADDVQLVKVSSSVEPSMFTLENSSVKSEIYVPSFSLKITDKASGYSFTAGGIYDYVINSVDSGAGWYLFNCTYLRDDFEIGIRFTLEEDGLKAELSSDSTNILSDEFYFPGPVVSRSSDYYIIPYATGLIFPVTQKFPFWRFQMIGWKGTMSFAGVTNLNNGYMIISEDPWNTDVVIEKPVGSPYYSIGFFHQPSKDMFDYTRTLHIKPIGRGGYITMTKKYREFAENMGWVKTFNKKRTENADIDKFIGAADIWLSPQHEGGLQNVDTLINYGVDRAMYSFSNSWYYPGGSSHIIDSCNARGLLTGRYDIYTDIFPPEHPDNPWYRSEGYPDLVVVNKDGSLLEGWLAFISDSIPFQGYYSCSSVHAEYAMDHIGSELDSLNFNYRFIDVELSSRLYDCYSDVHPVTKRIDARERCELLSVVHDHFGLVTGSEEARDWAFPYVDYGEGTMSIRPVEDAGYDWSTPVYDPDSAFLKYNLNPEIRIPLHGLVYHDVHVPTWYTGDGVSKVPAYWDDKDLFNILYGSMTLIMPPDYDYWRANKEKFITTINTVSAVFRKTGYSQMSGHTFLTSDRNVQQTTFDNGWNVTVNFGASDYSLGGVTLPSKGFYASDGWLEVYRTLSGGSQIAVVRLEDRLFMNPYGVEKSAYGVRSSGSVFIKLLDGVCRLAFVGDQNYVDIYPQQFIFPVDNLTAVTAGGTPVTLQTLSNGWVRINKSGDEVFYKLYGNFTGISESEKKKQKLSLNIYPNPLNPVTKIEYRLPYDSRITIEIFSITGERVESVVNEYQREGLHSIPFSRLRYASGVYICRIKTERESISKKMILLK